MLGGLTTVTEPEETRHVALDPDAVMGREEFHGHWGQLPNAAFFSEPLELGVLQSMTANTYSSFNAYLGQIGLKVTNPHSLVALPRHTSCVFHSSSFSIVSYLHIVLSCTSSWLV